MGPLNILAYLQWFICFHSLVTLYVAIFKSRLMSTFHKTLIYASFQTKLRYSFITIDSRIIFINLVYQKLNSLIYSHTMQSYIQQVARLSLDKEIVNSNPSDDIIFCNWFGFKMRPSIAQCNYNHGNSSSLNYIYLSCIHIAISVNLL